MSSRGALQAGNESGDPGPYQYTDLATQNVDRFGPDGEGALAYRTETAAGRLSARFYRFYPTDPAQFERTRTASLEYPNEELLTVGFDGEAVVLGGTHHLIAGWQQESRFFFTEVAGRELPVERAEQQIGLRGVWPLVTSQWGPLRLGYRLGLAGQSLSAEDSALPDFDPAWHRATQAVGLEARLGPDERQWALGVRAEQTGANGPGLPDGAAVMLWTVYAQRLHVSEGRYQRGNLGLTMAEGAARLKAVQHLARDFGTQRLALTLAVEGRLPEEDLDYDYWASRGYSGFHVDSVAYQAEAPQPSSSATVRVGWAAMLLPDVRAEASVEGRRFRGLYIAEPAFELTPGSVAPHGSIRAFADAYGDVLAAQAAVEGGQKLVRGRVFYSLLTDVGGSSSFRAAWSRVPRHRAGLTVTLRPDEAFSLRAALTGESATRWEGYEALDGAVAPNGYVYTAVTPARWLLDVTADKGFWARRVRLTMAFRNLLNSEERYHPLGAALDFRLYVRLAVQLHAP